MNGAVALKNSRAPPATGRCRGRRRATSNTGFASARKPDTRAVFDTLGILTDNVRSRVTRLEPEQDGWHPRSSGRGPGIRGRCAPVKKPCLPHLAGAAPHVEQVLAWCRPWRRCLSRTRR